MNIQIRKINLFLIKNTIVVYLRDLTKKAIKMA
nr:MAG TPA: hypothetical protein [Crassvirales sp.]